MIACMPTTEKNGLDIPKMEFIQKQSSEEEKIDMKDFDMENKKAIQTSPKLVPQHMQKQTEKRTFPYFRYDDKKRLNQIKGIIQQAQKGKPIRLYLENIPNFANEFDFQDYCPGLLNVVWNHKRANSCFILVEDKEYALDILDIESEIPPYCKEGRVFVTRVEENSILYAKKANPKRFESYFNLSDDSGFFIVESNKMKYYWYDSKRGFYDEFGIYYNQQGRPSPPPYINSNNRAGRSRKNNRSNNEKNSTYIEKITTNGEKNNTSNYTEKNKTPQTNEKSNSNQRNVQHQEQKLHSSPKQTGQRYQQKTQVEYVKKSILEQMDSQKQCQNEDQVQNIQKQQQQIEQNENQKEYEIQKKNQKKYRK